MDNTQCININGKSMRRGADVDILSKMYTQKKDEYSRDTWPALFNFSNFLAQLPTDMTNGILLRVKSLIRKEKIFFNIRAEGKKYI